MVDEVKGEVVEGGDGVEGGGRAGEKGRGGGERGGTREDVEGRPGSPEGARMGRGGEAPISARIEQNWERVNRVPKLCPEAAKRYDCDRRGRAVVCNQDKLKLKAKRHIVALGWIIESNSEGKLRFIAPNGKVYGDLREVCKLVTEQEEKVRAGSGAEVPIESKKKRPQINLNWNPSSIEPKPCPEAVVAYARERRPKLRPKAVRHLVSLGWMIECDGQRFRYRAPDGKMHISLFEICRSLTGPPEQDARGSSSTEQEETSEECKGPFSDSSTERSEAEAVEVEQNWERVVDIVPKLCLEDAKRYGSNKRGRAVVHSQDKLILKAKRHIVALGWIIESNSEGKLRFITPNGTIYDDLRELDWKPSSIEPNPCPEAVVAYAREGRRKFRPKAAQHLASLGWMIECDGEKFRYQAPNGKMHRNLRQICRSLTGPPKQDARGSSSMEQEETSED
ncbi:hypothetical protein QJS10_CPA03g01213 [Acorus calamus]|uniref:DUF7028 domain-containing protein n=1 Tax=Acorus calamus TaxID=4465 RepID=A0AAV9F8E6_ACOCL|nr:hypothetical protein QJS10_CPA03g01213 [Acorus calamus]